MMIFESISDQLAYQAIELPPGHFDAPAPGSRCSARRAHQPSRKSSPTLPGKRADRARPEGRTAHPVDKVEDYGALRDYANDLGVTLSTINSNTFQDDIYKFGSLTTSTKPYAARRSTTISSASRS